MKSGERILVTGATGFVAMHLMPLLVAKYSNVFALAREPGKARHLETLGVQVRCADLLDKNSLRKAVENVDVIIHLAALMSDKECLPLDEFVKLNVLGTRNLIEESRGNIKQFIHISTVGVYGDFIKKPAEEGQSYGRKLSKYESSKAQAEKLLLDFAAKYDFPFTILRLGQLYGSFMRYGWPDIFETMEKKRMFIIGSGNNLLQLTHASDAARGILGSILNEKCKNEIFNICAGKSYRIKDIFAVIAEELGVPFPKHLPYSLLFLFTAFFENIPQRFKKASLRNLDLHRLRFFSCNHVYSIEKAGKYFGYTPVSDLKPMMQATIKWYHENKRGEDYA
ncbi:MAG: NAD(P)-dependent oxidoreductase [Kiritimatiellia bacterium]|nr:NAD(P)-dependent oxidoreductase [Kiritimatiellia bacterium]